MGFVCDRCARCCRYHLVPVTGADVRRLVAHTGKTPEEFLELRSPDTVDVVGEPESLVDLPVGRRLVVLAHTHGGCVFLTPGPDGTETCSVHASRPSSCRAYPFDRPSAPADLPADSPVGLHPQPLCPPETGHLTVLHDRDAGTTWASAVAERDSELHAHAEWLLAFNRRQGLRRKLGKRLRSEADFFELLASPVNGEDPPHATEVAGAEQVEVNE